MRIWESKTIKEKLGCGRNIYITVREDKKLIVQMGKSGQCHRAILEALQNLINLALSNGNGIEEVIDCLKHIRCEAPTLGGATSCVDYIARILREEVEE